MLKKNFLITFVVIVMVATLGLFQGCSENDKVTEPLMTETDLSQIDSVLGEYSFTEFVGISADSINALGIAAMNEDQGKGSGASKTAGWQLYTHVPFYSQNDGSWSRKKLGYGWCGSTISSHGCHLCCVSMLYAKWGYYNMNPAVLNDWRGHYAFSRSNCGDLLRPYQALQYPNICRNVRWISAGRIYHELQRGRPVVIEVGAYGGSHFMIIFAFDGSRFWVKDPLRDWRGQDRPLYGSFRSARVYGY